MVSTLPVAVELPTDSLTQVHPLSISTILRTSTIRHNLGVVAKLGDR